MFKWIRHWAGAVALAGLLGAAPAYAGYANIYVFGDSLSDDGGSRTAVALGGSPPARTSDGPVAVEVLASRMTANLFDYAIGGAKTGSGNTDYASGPLQGSGMRTQVGLYLNELLLSQTPADAAALYIVAGGSNDVLEALLGGTDLSLLFPTMIDNLLQSVGELYTAGARHLVLSLLPDISASPDARFMLNGDVVELAKLSQAIAGFNAALAAAFEGLATTAPDAEFITFDLFAAQRAILDNPGAYGLSDVQGSCVVDQALTCDSYFFWDTQHPTAAASRLIADQLAAAVPAPGTLALVALCLSGLAMRRRRAPVVSA